MLTRYLTATLLTAITCTSAMAATTTIEIDPTNTIPNVIANKLIADGQGDDWTGAALQIDLTAGSIYNDPAFGATGGTGDGTQAALWPFVPELRWDSAVGIANDSTAGIAGRAGACGGCFPQNLDGSGDGAADINWFNTDTGNTSPVQIANISMTNDAAGVWSLITSYTGGLIESSGLVTNGVMVPEPASFTLLGAYGLTLLRRHKH